MNFSGDSEDSPPGLSFLTPLLDVIFLLLIFFMLETVFNKIAKNLDINLATVKIQQSQTNQYEQNQIIINILEDGTVEVNKFTVNKKDLIKTLKKVKDEFNSIKIIIRADKNTLSETVFSIIQLCKSNRFNKILYQVQ